MSLQTDVIWKRESCYSRPGAKVSACSVCKHPFTMHYNGWKKTPILVREYKDSWFRGDDTVHFAHIECAKEGQS